jgi:hypothetical protein
VSVTRLFVASAALIVLAACATTTQKYNWGKYDPALYGYYRNPTKLAELSETLEAIIKSADANKTRVPPGIYAEYGYLQLQAGKNAEAVTMFQQEEARWPESKVFMDRMIKVAAMPGPAVAAPAATP